MFQPLPDKPDSNALELEVLETWEREGTFEQLRGRNRGGLRWSFIDGPVTANKSLGVHTAWGRTLKDVFQRYKAMRGFDQRYQNGFDCQGLWIEVGVERELGLNSKREIEDYGLEKFAARCRDVVVRFPLLDRPGESLVVWTTTPWTLPANVAAAVRPESEYGRRENGEWVLAERYPDERFVERKRGDELVGWRYRGPFDDLPAARG